MTEIHRVVNTTEIVDVPRSELVDFIERVNRVLPPGMYAALEADEDANFVSIYLAEDVELP